MLHKTAYSFMAPNGHPAKLVLHILGVGLAECVVFVVVHGLIVLRQRLVARLMTSRQPSDTQSSVLSDEVSVAEQKSQFFAV